jgi:hypothetical protein
MPTIRPIISIISRDTGEQCWWGRDHADMRTCRTLIADTLPAGSTWLYTDEWQRAGAVIQPRPPSARVYANGRGMTIGMADVRSHGQCEMRHARSDV